MSTPEPIRYWSSNGVRSGLLVNRGRRWLYIMLMDYPIRIRRVPVSAIQSIKALKLKGQPYPVTRAVNIFKRSVKRCYGTLRKAPKNVRKALS